MAQKFHALQQVASELIAAGAEVRFWTDAAFRPEVEAIGASFVDLFDPVTLDAADDATLPRPSRYVTFAAQRGAAVAEQVAAWGAELVVYDSFTLVGEVVGRRLGIPWVPVFSGHLVDYTTLRSIVASDPRVAIDPRCVAAVARLQDEFGMTDVTRFSYFAKPGPWLNIACEPEEWVDAAELQLYQPLACFGKLSAEALARARNPATTGPLRIYAGFGTIIWWSWSALAAAALETIAEAARSIGARLVVGLGGGTLPEATRDRLVASGVVIHDFADQVGELGSADLFVTHGGATSVHEAIVATVPMLSFPFFVDQPYLAARCQELGLAVPLISGTALEESLDLERVTEVMRRAIANRSEMRDALLRARAWELKALAQRPAIARRILALRRDFDPGA